MIEKVNLTKVLSLNSEAESKRKLGEKNKKEWLYAKRDKFASMSLSESSKKRNQVLSRKRQYPDAVDFLVLLSTAIHQLSEVFQTSNEAKMIEKVLNETMLRGIKLLKQRTGSLSLDVSLAEEKVLIDIDLADFCLLDLQNQASQKQKEIIFERFKDKYHDLNLRVQDLVQQNFHLELNDKKALAMAARLQKQAGCKDLHHQPILLKGWI